VLPRGAETGDDADVPAKRVRDRPDITSSRDSRARTVFISADAVVETRRRAFVTRRSVRSLPTPSAWAREAEMLRAARASDIAF
jgi:hypothetical protein